MTPTRDTPIDHLAELLQQSGPRPAPSSAAVDAARAQARAVWQAEIQRTRRRRHAAIAAFALASAAVLVIAVGRYRSPDLAPRVIARVDGSGTTLNLGAVFRTDGVTRSRLSLTNGVELRVDTDTEIRFPADATIALERGAVFVDSGSSRGGSVEIRTSAAVTRDIGTRFEVRVLAGTTRVRVQEGIVQVIQGKAMHTLRRGTEAIADASGVARRPGRVAGPDWNWVTVAASPFQLEGKTLSQFLEWVAREGGWQINFSDEALRRTTSGIVLHGSIAGVSTDEALAIILPTCGLTHGTDGDVVMIQRASTNGDRQ